MLVNEFKLSYSPSEEGALSRLSEQLYYENLSTLADIHENSVSIKTLYIFEHNDTIEARIFIVNHTKSNINFDLLPLSIIDENGETIASELIRLSGVGQIPPMNVRPHTIFFSRSSLVEGKTIHDTCRVIIEMEAISGCGILI